MGKEVFVAMVPGSSPPCTWAMRGRWRTRRSWIPGHNSESFRWLGFDHKMCSNTMPRSSWTAEPRRRTWPSPAWGPVLCWPSRRPSPSGQTASRARPPPPWWTGWKIFCLHLGRLWNSVDWRPFLPVLVTSERRNNQYLFFALVCTPIWYSSSPIEYKGHNGLMICWMMYRQCDQKKIANLYNKGDCLCACVRACSL